MLRFLRLPNGRASELCVAVPGFEGCCWHQGFFFFPFQASSLLPSFIFNEIIPFFEGLQSVQKR